MITKFETANASQPVTTNCLILMDKLHNESFDDARDRAEDLSVSKNMPVKFNYWEFSYIVEMVKP